MGLLELFLIAVGLSMDAFAVAVCKGLSMRKMRYGQAAVIALFFGGFQGADASHRMDFWADSLRSILQVSITGSLLFFSALSEAI